MPRAASSVGIPPLVLLFHSAFGTVTPLPACAAEPPPSRVLEPDGSGPVRYEAAFFERFAKRTALDMVRQVPSFSFRDTNKEQRGYARAVGNVLIDGERPSAKSQTLEDILSRIPAAQVRRIEVLRGTESRAEAYGDAVLANV